MISTTIRRLFARRRAAVSFKALLRVEALETRFCPSGTAVAALETQDVQVPAAQAQQPAQIVAVEQTVAPQANLSGSVITPDAAAAVFAASPIATAPTLAPVALGKVVALEDEGEGGGSYCMGEDETPEGFAIINFQATQNSTTSWTLRGKVVNIPTPTNEVDIVFGGMQEFQDQHTYADQNGNFEFTIDLPANVSGIVTAQAINGEVWAEPVMTTIGNS